MPLCNTLSQIPSETKRVQKEKKSTGVNLASFSREFTGIYTLWVLGSGKNLICSTHNFTILTHMLLHMLNLFTRNQSAIIIIKKKLLQKQCKLTTKNNQENKKDFVRTPLFHLQPPHVSTNAGEAHYYVHLLNI